MADEDVLAKARALWRQGGSLGLIAEAVGLPVQAVAQMLHREIFEAANRPPGAE